MHVVILPPIEFVEGYPFEQTWIWMDDATGDPIDFTETVNGVGWTARFTIADDLDAAPSYEVAPVLSADGEIYLSMSASDFAFLTPPAQIGGGVVAVFQIQLNAPVSQMSQVFQGPVKISGII